MGADAWVRCSCYENGLATPPPVPVRVDADDQIVPVDPADHDALTEWRRSACAHPRMAAASVAMNWSMLWSLRGGLTDAGGEARFPVLLANLPEWNGAWYLSPAEAATALAELRTFAEAHGRVPMDRLVAGDGETTVFETNRGHAEWWRTASPGVLGLTGRGTFAVWPGPDPGAPPLFESARFRQEIRDSGADLTDHETGATHHLAHALDHDGTTPKEWQVVTVEATAEQAYPLLAPLTELLEKAVDDGRHVELG